MDALHAMQVFCAVVEENGFSAAARRLDLSNAAVSKHVAALEERLGARLLNRTTRRISLTEAGQAYYARCAKILEDIDEAERAITHLTAQPRGTLRVNAPMSFGVDHVVPALGDFLRAYPEIHVDLELTDRYVDLIDEGFDMAVRVADLPDSSLIAKKLAPMRLALVAAPSYLAAHGRPARPEDLSGHQCLRYTVHGATDVWRFAAANGEPRLVKISGPLAVNNGDAVLNAALAGLGIGALPTFIAGAALCDGRLVELLEGQLLQNSSIYAVYPHSRLLSPKVRAFVEFRAARFKPTPYWEPDGQTARGEKRAR